jgi:hypothetical protein
MHKVLLFALMLFTFSTNAQVIKLRAKKSAFIEYEKKGKVKWNESDFLIIINTTDKKITFYSDDKREFSYYKTIKIPEDTSKSSDTYGSTTLQFKCIDVEGKECNITLAALDKKQSSYNSRVCLLYSSYALMVDVNPE